MQISHVQFPVTALGPGSRLVVWVQGCPLRCAGCMSRDTWDPGGGTTVAIEHLVGRWRAALAAGATGLTISGGEPMEQPQAMVGFLRRIDEERRRHAATEADILLFTGYELEELDELQHEVAAAADALITGRYRVAEPTDLIWRGSANQQLRSLTELGRRRYRPFLHATPARPPIQIEAHADGFRLIGVPRRKTLSTLEQALRRDRLAVDTVTWRPFGRTHVDDQPAT